jgi:hypothetical protein
MNNKKRKEFLKVAPFRSYSVADINFLRNIWVINGIWAEYMPKSIRDLMTWLFWDTLSFIRHDISFWKQQWFHKANRGLIKYSFISIAFKYKNIHKLKLYKKLYIVPRFFITLPFKCILICIAYSLVESSAWKRAYQNAGNIV